MRGMPGGLKPLVNEAACFHRCLGDKLLQNNQSVQLLCLRGWKAAALSLIILGIFSVYAENALKMQRMWMLENYVDPHHRILSDALPEASWSILVPLLVGGPVILVHLMGLMKEKRLCTT